MKKKTLIALITTTIVLVAAFTSIIVTGRKTNVNTDKNIQGLNEELSDLGIGVTAVMGEPGSRALMIYPESQTAEGTKILCDGNDLFIGDPAVAGPGSALCALG